MITKILLFLKKYWKIIIIGGLIAYAGIETIRYVHLNNLYNTALASTKYLQGRIDTEMRDLKDALDKANINLEQHGLTIENQRNVIDQLETGKTKLTELNRQLQTTNRGLEETNNRLESTNREINATNQRLGKLIDDITGIQHNIESGNSDAINIAGQCLKLVQQLEKNLR